MKRRREQVYEEFTISLVPNIHYKIQRQGRTLPDVGFIVKHPGDAPPARLKVMIDTYVGGVVKNHADADPLYRGELLWNLNPSFGVNGHFYVVDEACKESVDLRVAVRVTVVDVYDRSHERLPLIWAFDQTSKIWWLDPVDPDEIPRRRNSTYDAVDTLTATDDLKNLLSVSA